MIYKVGRTSGQSSNVRYGKTSSIKNVFYFGCNLLFDIGRILGLFVRSHDLLLRIVFGKAGQASCTNELLVVMGVIICQSCQPLY